MPTFISNDKSADFHSVLSSYKKAYTDNLEKVRRDAYVFFPVPNDVVDARLSLAKHVSSFQQMLTLASFRFPQMNSEYKGVAPLSPPASTYIGPRFDDSPIEWHSIFGQGPPGKNKMVFAIGVMRVDVAYHKPLYIINGGIGLDGTWYPFPLNAGTGTWSTPSTGVHSFVTTTVPQGFASFSATFNASKDALKYTVKYSKEGGESLNLAVTAKSLAATTAVFQGKGGCVPICFGGVGTSYLSYPLLDNTTVNVSYNKSPSKTFAVTAWFDHQWLVAGIPRSPSSRYLYGLLQGGHKEATMRWVWFGMQVPGEQYGGSFLLTEADLPLKVSSSLVGTVNRFQLPHDPTESTLNLKALGTVKTVSAYKAHEGKVTYEFPTKLEIKIGNKTFTLTAALHSEVVYMPTGLFNWEGPATVSGDAKGTGFIECSNFLSATDSAKIAFADFPPLTPSIVSGLLPHRTSTRTRWWFGEWFASILVLLVMVVILWRRGQKKWSRVAAVGAVGATIAIVAPTF